MLDFGAPDKSGNVISSSFGSLLLGTTELHLGEGVNSRAGVYSSGNFELSLG